MTFSDTYEAPLRSYIENRMGALESTLEGVARNRSNIEATQLEEQIDRHTNDFIADVTRRLHKTRDEIKSHRPSNNEDPDYGIRLARYQQLVQSSSTGVNQVTEWIQSLFDKILSVIKTIVQWITDNAQTILDIIKQIRDAFQLITVVFNRH